MYKLPLAILMLLSSCGVQVKAIEIPKTNKPNVAATQTQQTKEPVETKGDTTTLDLGEQENQDAVDNVTNPTVIATPAEILPSTALELKFSGLRSNSGQLCYLIFADAAAFPQDISQATYSGCVKIDSGFTSIKLDIETPKTPIAISVFQDENSDNDLNTKGTFGIPSEPYGFSNNPGLTIGPPSFEACAVQLKEGIQVINIELMTLF